MKVLRQTTNSAIAGKADSGALSVANEFEGRRRRKKEREL